MSPDARRSDDQAGSPEERHGTHRPLRAPAPTGAEEQLIALSQQVGEDQTVTEEVLASTALVLVCDLVLPARWASLTHRAAQPRTTAASDECAAALDTMQYRTGGGPCLEALVSGSVVVSDFATESRWPAFTHAAVTGSTARGALSYPLALAGHPATALNLYTDDGGSFDAVALHDAAVAAAGLALTLTAVRQRRRTDGSEQAAVGDRRLGAAIGIIMQRYGWTYDEAYDALHRESVAAHRTLDDVVRDVVLRGVLPTRRGSE